MKCKVFFQLYIFTEYSGTFFACSSNSVCALFFFITIIFHWTETRLHIISLPLSQILNTSKVSQAVTLFYVVNNQSTTLNGTISSNLLNQLSAELVGFYLTYPPLTIAECKYVLLNTHLQDQPPPSFYTANTFGLKLSDDRLFWW